MVAIPDQLTWELTRRNTSFLRKKNGHTKRSGAVQFSVEPGNLASLNQFKYSGLANSQVFDVASEDGKAVLVKKTKKSGKRKSLAKTPLSRPFAKSV